MPLTSFTANNTARASEVNANFALCVLTDTARTVTVTHTYSATQTFTGGFTTGADVTLSGDLLFTDATHDIGASGATRPRDLFLSRNAVMGGTIAVTGAATLSSTLAVTGNVAVNTNKFTVTAASGNTAVAGTLAVTGASTLAAVSATTGTFSGLGDFTTGPLALRLSGQATAHQYMRVVNTGGTVVLGVSASDGSGLLTGASNYATVITTENATALLLGTDNTLAVTIGSDQAVTLAAGITATSGTFSGNVQIAGGATISKFLTATLNWDPSAAADDHEIFTTTVEVTGAAVNDLALVGVYGATPGTANTGAFKAWVSAADEVTVQYIDQSVDELGHNPTAVDLRIMVIRFA